MRWSHAHTQSLECEEHLLARCHRPRVNSAIFVSAEPQGFAGFDAGEFLRRHGSQSKLCRKARSVVMYKKYFNIYTFFYNIYTCFITKKTEILYSKC